jgi:ADP-ribosylglycohydrolase
VPTDDTAQTAIVLRAYRDGYSPEHVADGLLAWFEARPKDVGGATVKALTTYAQTRDARRSGAGAGQRGNGSLMRCLPTGLVRTDPVLRAAEAREVSAITHDDAVCTEACAAYNEVVAALLDGAGSVEAVRAAAHACCLEEVATALALGAELDLNAAADAGDPGVAHGNRVYVLDSLSLAVAALLDGRSFEEVLIDIVSFGGDSDTTGAIAGGVLGARDGVGAIPERWLARLWLRQEFDEASE